MPNALTAAGRHRNDRLLNIQDIHGAQILCVGLSQIGGQGMADMCVNRDNGAIHQRSLLASVTG